jgi:WD40 repeat protein
MAQAQTFRRSRRCTKVASEPLNRRHASYGNPRFKCSATVAISPDNRWVVTGSDDKTARLWLLQMKDLMHLARITVGRNFSADEWRLYFPGEKYRKTFEELPGADNK